MRQIFPTRMCNVTEWHSKLLARRGKFSSLAGKHAPSIYYYDSVLDNRLNNPVVMHKRSDRSSTNTSSKHPFIHTLNCFRKSWPPILFDVQFITYRDAYFSRIKTPIEFKNNSLLFEKYHFTERYIIIFQMFVGIRISQKKYLHIPVKSLKILNTTLQETCVWKW